MPLSPTRPSDGRFAVSDVVFLGSNSELPDEVLHAVELRTGCVAGALEKEEYEELLSAAGFESFTILAHQK